jgi:hypothetical protein
MPEIRMSLFGTAHGKSLDLRSPSRISWQMQAYRSQKMQAYRSQKMQTERPIKSCSTLRKDSHGRLQISRWCQVSTRLAVPSLWESDITPEPPCSLTPTRSQPITKLCACSNVEFILRSIVLLLCMFAYFDNYLLLNCRWMCLMNFTAKKACGSMTWVDTTRPLRPIIRQGSTATILPWYFRSRPRS